MKINVNLFPRLGYRFKERDGSWIVSTNSWTEVMAKVENYRKRNHLPVGNVEAEVMNSACKENPGYCSEENPETLRMRKVVSLKGRVLSWLNLFRRTKDKSGHLDFVQREEAAKRAEICAKCQNNEGLPEGCASCRATLKANRESILGNKRLIDQRLKGCLVLGEDLPTSVWLDRVTEENGALPPQCWRKRTL